MKYQHRRHNKNLLMVHLIFVTKYRESIFYGPFRQDVKQYMYEICCQHHWYIRRMETDRDHVHILLQYNPADSITTIVRTLKQQSAWRAWQSYETLLRKHYWKKRILWSDSYFAASVGQVSQETIKQYIANQG